jgi:hypothetical protein
LLKKSQKRGFSLNAMPEITRLSEFQYQIPIFAINEDFDGFYAQFLKSDLGKIYLSTPFSALADTFKLKDSKKGTCCFFSPKGKIALMMLKNYYGCSDKKLIELLNGNIFMQFFCDILIAIDKPLKSFKIVSQIRMELSKILDIRKAQETLGHINFLGIRQKVSPF